MLSAMSKRWEWNSQTYLELDSMTLCHYLVWLINDEDDLAKCGQVVVVFFFIIWPSKLTKLLQTEAVVLRYNTAWGTYLQFS